MKKIIAFLLTLVVVFSLCSCSSGGGTKENIGQVETIDLTTDLGSIQYVGIEKAYYDLVKDNNGMLVKFSFSNFQDRPTKVQSVFKIKFYQNGVELGTYAGIYSDGKEQYDLAGKMWKEVMKDGTITFAATVPTSGDGPLTIGVESVDNSDVYQMMEVDLATALTTQETNVSEETPETNSTPAKGGVIDMNSENGAIRYVGIERANKGLCDSSDVVVVSFDFTNYKSTPAQCQSAFYIKFYQDGVQVDTASWTSSKGGEHYNLCSNYFHEALKDGTVTFGRPVPISSNNPLTIIVEDADNRDNYQMIEVEVPA